MIQSFSNLSYLQSLQNTGSGCKVKKLKPLKLITKSNSIVQAILR